MTPKEKQLLWKERQSLVSNYRKVMQICVRLWKKIEDPDPGYPENTGAKRVVSDIYNQCNRTITSIKKYEQ